MSLRSILTPTARSALRSAPSTAQRRAFSRSAGRFNSSKPSQTPNDPSPVVQKSDMPWAVGSILIFGSAFIYLTAPPKKGSHGGHGGHGGHDSHGKQDEKEKGELDEELEAHFNNPGKVQETEDHHPEGNKVLASKSSSLDEAHEKQKNKPKREPSAKPDNTTFKKGIEASKDGNHVSNPKAVVAASHTEKQDRAEKKKAEKAEKEAETADGDDEEKDE